MHPTSAASKGIVLTAPTPAPIFGVATAALAPFPLTAGAAAPALAPPAAIVLARLPSAIVLLSQHSCRWTE